MSSLKFWTLSGSLNRFRRDWKPYAVSHVPQRVFSHRQRSEAATAEQVVQIQFPPADTYKAGTVLRMILASYQYWAAFFFPFP